MKRICLSAPGKINLYLDIVGLREDGYHLLEMVLQSVSLADRITLSLGGAPGIRVQGGAKGFPEDETNVCWKAASRLFAALGLSPAVDIQVEKQIPIQAGMGGGSADAAAVLLGLSELLESGMTLAELQALGESVGADVPFCLQGGTALVRGIGEKIAPLSSLTSGYFAVAKPEMGISTAQAFRRWDEKGQRPCSGRGSAALCRALADGDLARVGKELFNAFLEGETPARVREAIALLGRDSLGAVMSGSGSACFGLFSREEAARDCCRKLEAAGFQSFLAEPVPHGPQILG